MKNPRGFASDNNAGVHPEILNAITEANVDHAVGYGDDEYTKKAIAKIKSVFGKDTDVYFVFTGTGANVLGLSAATNSFNSVICAETAHINVDECGAPEKFSGCKLLSLPTPDGKLTVDLIIRHMHGFDFEHHSQPKIISITQSTEMGTVYTTKEIHIICDYAHKHNMLVHMDGARIANAAVSLGADFKEMTTNTGVDILSFGGTKNGMMYGEAIVFFNKNISADFKYIRKQGMQLASKMRFISAQFNAYLRNDLWKKNAEHANYMAQLLADKVKDIPGIEITQKVQSNGVFAIVPEEMIPKLQSEYFFYMWDEAKSEVRWMTAFDTTEEDVKSFAALVRELAEN